LANAAGDVEQPPGRLVDLNNPNLKPWVVDHLQKANEEALSGKLQYRSRASCRPAGVPMFLTFAGQLQPPDSQSDRRVAEVGINDFRVA
jgi:hypothetical protein